MAESVLKIEELRTLIQKGEASDPLVFLESIMNGQDPRRLSSLYELIMEIDDFTDGDIPRSDWNELVDNVLQNHKYKPVSLNDSQSAANTLAQYLHAKRKHVEGDIGFNGNSAEHTPLTEEEIELFKEKFNDEF